MSKKSSEILRSSSYYSMLRPMFSDYHTYATCPPINLHQHLTSRIPTIVPTATPSLTTATKQPSQSSHHSLTHSHSSHSQSCSLRAFNFNVNPLWRHGGLHHHQRKPSQNGFATSSDSGSGGHKQLKKQQQKYHAVNTAGKASSSTTTSVLKKCSSQLEHLPRGHQQMIMQRSLPVFEVLPPLMSNSTHDLVYQNSYLLDGVQYDYGSEKSLNSSNGKLRLDYAKFLKSISSKSRPSDRDLIFGNAKLLLSNARGWERSRIEWLLELERRQELHRRRTERNGKRLPAHREQNEIDEDDDELLPMLCCLPFRKNRHHIVPH